MPLILGNERNRNAVHEMSDWQSILTAVCHGWYLWMSSFMFLNFKSLAEVRNQSEKQQTSVFANGIGLGSQGRYSFIKHLLNVYHISHSLVGWCRDESQSLPSRVPVSSRETGQEPNKDNTAKVPSMLCEDWTEGAYLRQHVADCFSCDIFSNPLDILLQIWNYAFILMYDGYVH